MTRYRNHVRVVFTGSAEVALRELFTRSRAAMYEGASTLAFPVLDESFLSFLAARTRTLFKRTLNLKDCADAFVALHRRPRAMIDLLLLYLSLDTPRSLTDLVGQQLEAHLLERDYGALWAAMSPLERIICCSLLLRFALTSKDSLLRYGQYVRKGKRGASLSAGNVSTSLAALQSKHIIVRGPLRGQYRFDDPVFAE